MILLNGKSEFSVKLDADVCQILTLLPCLRDDYFTPYSDMSAFKAANPDAVFEDFIRWHSPGDWETVENKDSDSSGKGATVNADWPPHGRLSARMSEHGNSWRQLWNESPSLPVSEQKPLIDPVREGEKVPPRSLHLISFLGIFIK